MASIVDRERRLARLRPPQKRLPLGERMVKITPLPPSRAMASPHNPFSPPRLPVPIRFLRPALAAALALLGLVGVATLLACRQDSAPLLMRGDELLLLPDRQALDHRLQLVEGGHYADAQVLWATRALLPRLSSTFDSAEMTWNRNIAGAIEVGAGAGSRPHTLVRLGRAFDRARWFREASAVLEQARALAPLDDESQRLWVVNHTITRLAAAADSLARARYAAADRGESPATGLGAAAASLVNRFGLTLEALTARGLYLGTRVSPSRFDVDELQLAVIVHHEGPFSLPQREVDVSVRRIVLDDDFIAPYRIENASPWDPGSAAMVEDGTLVVIHDRSALRRAAALLYLELERRGGNPGVPENGDLDSRAALALRLRSVSPLFDRIRADGGARDEMLRRFILELSSARMTQVEAGEARRMIAEHNQPGTTAGARGAELRLLGAIAYGPLPGLRLADVIELARRAPAADPRGEAARTILAEVHRRIGGGEANDVESLVSLGEERLRELARAIDARSPL